MNKLLKKATSIMLVLVLTLSCIACNKAPEPSTSTPVSTNTASTSTSTSTTTAAPTTTATTTTTTTTSTKVEEVKAPVEPEKFEFASDLFNTGSVGRNGAAACASDIASKIATDILQKGGNAVDAMVAMIYAVGMLEPAASGLGGAGQMLIYLAEEDRYVALEYMTEAPGAAITGVLDTNTSSNPPSPEALAIPGVVHGTLTALEKYGTMSAKEVLQPVIDLGRKGFPVTARWNANIDGRFDNLNAYPYTMGLYTDEGFMYNIGDKITNKDLADTIELIANEGIDGFYNSDFTQKMVDYIQSVGGVLTREDFAQYKTVEREPLTTNYRGYTVTTTTAPSNGGAALLEMLNILENYDLASMGHDSANTVALINDAYALGYQDGYSFIADPDYYNLPIDTILDKEYAKTRTTSIKLGQKIGTARAGRLEISLNETGQKVLEANSPDQGGTTHMVCVDKWGNVVSSTNTNGINFGSAIAVPGTGFVFNAHLSNLNNRESRANQLMPYTRVRSTTCPTIVADENGKPVLAVGSPGNWALVSAALNAVVNFVDFGMDIGEVTNAPRTWRDGTTKTLYVEGLYSDETIEGLRAMGYDVLDDGIDYSSHVGCLAAIEIKDGLLYAIGDNRRNYGSSAY